MEPKIIAVDFDGTLVTDKFPNIGEPIEEVVSFVKNMKAEGHKIILWTSRNDERLTSARDYCKYVLDIEFDAVNTNLPEIIEMYGTDTRKVFADVYIDDKAVNHNGIPNFGEQHIEEIIKRIKSS